MVTAEISYTFKNTALC